MRKDITFEDITGKRVSGRFEVSEGLITVTLSDGTKTTADIEESMLSQRYSQGCFYCRCIGPSGWTQTANIYVRTKRG
jgi:hypothetical protein